MKCLLDVLNGGLAVDLSHRHRINVPGTRGRFNVSSLNSMVFLLIGIAALTSLVLVSITILDIQENSFSPIG